MTTDLQYAQSENVLTLTKQFDAPKEKVFSMFSSPEQIVKWWGPTDWPAAVISFDFTPGGKWHYYMQGQDGDRSYGIGIYNEIDEPNLISYTDAFSDESGAVNDEMPQGETTYRFVEEEGKTTLTATVRYQTVAQVDELLRMGMVEGVTDSWNQLEDLLAEPQN